MGLMLLVIVLFSAFYIAAKAGHDCTGEDCPVCACIQQSKDTLHEIGGGTAAQLSSVIPVLLILLNAALFVAELPQATLVSRKIRLNLFSPTSIHTLMTIRRLMRKSVLSGYLTSTRKENTRIARCEMQLLYNR